MKYRGYLVLAMSFMTSFPVSAENVFYTSLPASHLSANETDQAVKQLLQAADDEGRLTALINNYSTAIKQNRPFVRDVIIRSLDTLKSSINPTNLQNYRIKLSGILNFTEALFPNANVSQWLINPGKNVSDEFLPEELAEQLRRNPELRVQLLYSIGLTSQALQKLGKAASTVYKTDETNQNTFIVTEDSLENILAKYVFPYPNQRNENYFLIKAPKQLGGLHYTTLVTQWKNGSLNIGILDSLGFNTTNQIPYFSNIYANIITQMSLSYRVNTAIYTTQTKRQQDIVSCPQFILNDYFTFKDAGFFNYVNSITSERADLVNVIPALRSPFSSTIIIPEHPLMLVPMQSRTVLTMLKQNGLVERYIASPSTFYKNMDDRFWTLSSAGGRSVNIQTQLDILNLVPLLLAEIL